jgi:uncharacterized protein
MRPGLILRFPLRCKLAAIPLIALAFSMLCAHAEQTKDIQPTGYVTDLASVVSPETKARLETLCTELQQKTEAQLAVVTVNSLEGESVEDYAVALYKQLGVGAKGTDRGALLLVAPKDRKYRVEVGYGLEPVINDARAGDVGRAMVPLLRQGDYNGAIEAATWQLAQYIAAERGVTLSGQPPRRQIKSSPDEDGKFPFGWLIFALILLFFLMGSRRGGSQGRRLGPRGGGGWWIGPMIGGGWGGRGGWGGGGFGGGGGGFFGGGGFGGFGGGSSGGGGASGSW